MLLFIYLKIKLLHAKFVLDWLEKFWFWLFFVYNSCYCQDLLYEYNIYKYSSFFDKHRFSELFCIQKRKDLIGYIYYYNDKKTTTKSKLIFLIIISFGTPYRKEAFSKISIWLEFVSFSRLVSNSQLYSCALKDDLVVGDWIGSGMLWNWFSWMEFV